MGQTSGQPSYGQAPTNGPMPGGNPSLGGANMPSMQGPAVNVPQLYQMLAQFQGGGGMPGMGGATADIGMQMPRGMGTGQDMRGNPAPGMPDSRMRAPAPGQGAPMQRPPMVPPTGGMPPQIGTMPGAGQAGPQITPDMIAALRSRMGGTPAPSSSMLDLLGAGRAGGTIGDPTRRRA